MIRYALPALLFAAALPAHAQAPVDHPPLIERAKIFGNPSKSGGRISPDGKWLSWIAPRDGVLNVWVAPSSDLAQARPLTQEKVRPIRSSFWSPDSTTLLFIQDKGGDENFLLYGVNVHERQAGQLHAVREDPRADRPDQQQGQGAHPGGHQ